MRTCYTSTREVEAGEPGAPSYHTPQAYEEPYRLQMLLVNRHPLTALLKQNLGEICSKDIIFQHKNDLYNPV